MDRMFLIRYTYPLNFKNFNNVDINRCLELFIHSHLQEIFLNNGYGDVFEEKVYLNNEKLFLLSNDIITEKMLGINFPVDLVNIFYEELKDFLRNFENTICHRISMNNFKNIYFHCFSTFNFAIIAMEAE